MVDQQDSDSSNAEAVAMERQTYLDHRKSLVDLGAAQLASYDKTLLLLSTGAIGASALFVDTFVGEGTIENQPLLAFAWAVFALTMFANLLSYLSSWYDTEIERRELDLKYSTGDFHRAHVNLARDATKILNLLALIFFIVGIVVLLFFCYGNL